MYLHKILILDTVFFNKGRGKIPSTLQNIYICTSEEPLALFCLAGRLLEMERGNSSSQSLKDVNFEIVTVARQFISLKAISSSVTTREAKHQTRPYRYYSEET